MKTGFTPVVCKPQKKEERSKWRERIETAIRRRKKTQDVKAGGLRVQRKP